VSSDAVVLTFTRIVAVVTMACYTAGHAAIGFPFFLVGTIGRLLTLRPPLWRRTPLDLPLAAFGVILVLSTAVSAYRSIAVPSMLLTVISSVVLFGSFAWLVGRDPGTRATLLRAWALGGPPAAVIGVIAGRLVHERAFFPRMPMGTNAFGTMLFLGSVVALGLAYRAEGRERKLWFACSLVSLVGLLTTESRSALAGWAAGAVYLTWRELRAHPRQLAAALATGIAVLALAASAVPSVASRVGHVSTDLVVDRVQIWRIAVGIVQAHPLLGTGPGTFQVMFNQRKPIGFERKWSAHNLWLHYAVETGLLGLLSILWVVSAAGREWVRSGRLAPSRLDPLRPTITAVSIGLLIDQCGDNTLLSVSTISGAWLLLALLVVPLAHPARPGAAPTRGDEDRVPTVPLAEAVLATGTRSRERPP
jgi:putative inorganic carbon (HCO3(-)) transporter